MRSEHSSRIIYPFFCTLLEHSAKCDGAGGSTHSYSALFQTSFAAVNVRCPFKTAAASYIRIIWRKTVQTGLTEAHLLGGFMEGEMHGEGRDLVVRGVSFAVSEARWTVTIVNSGTAYLMEFHLWFYMVSWKLVSQLFVKASMYHKPRLFSSRFGTLDCWYVQRFSNTSELRYGLFHSHLIVRLDLGSSLRFLYLSTWCAVLIHAFSFLGRINFRQDFIELNHLYFLRYVAWIRPPRALLWGRSFMSFSRNTLLRYGALSAGLKWRSNFKIRRFPRISFFTFQFFNIFLVS